MSNINNGGPAFPLTVEEEGCLTQVHTGMSLRTYIACKALPGLLAGAYNESCQHNLSEVPKEAVAIADALIAELFKGSTK